MAKFTVVLAFATMLKLIPTDSLLDVNRVILFFVKEEITNPKCNGDSEKKQESIMDLFMLCKETLNRKNTSCLLPIGQQKFGLKS